MICKECIFNGACRFTDNAVGITKIASELSFATPLSIKLNCWKCELNIEKEREDDQI